MCDTKKTLESARSLCVLIRRRARAGQRAEARDCYAIECSLGSCRVSSRPCCLSVHIISRRDASVARLSVTSQRSRVIAPLSGATEDSEVVTRTRTLSDGCTSIRVSMLTAHEYRRRPLSYARKRVTVPALALLPTMHVLLVPLASYRVYRRERNQRSMEWELTSGTNKYHMIIITPR